MEDLRKLGYSSRMKYNGEVIADNIQEENVVIEKKNHKLIIQLKEKKNEDKDDPNSKASPDSS